jgi:hypothetical protein
MPDLEQLYGAPEHPSEPCTAWAFRGRPSPAPGEWPDRMGRVLSREISDAVASGVLTTADAEQLLARLLLVIDQATTPSRPASPGLVDVSAARDR